MPSRSSNIGFPIKTTPREVLVYLIFMALAVALFLSRYPKGYVHAVSVNGPYKKFRFWELVVAVLSPGFYIPYFLASDPVDGIIVREGYRDVGEGTLGVVFSLIWVGISVGALILWAYRTGYTTGWTWGRTNFLGFLGALFFPVIYLPYTYIDPITNYPKYAQTYPKK